MEFCQLSNIKRADMLKRFGEGKLLQCELGATRRRDEINTYGGSKKMLSLSRGHRESNQEPRGRGGEGSAA
jgi:hypothetical protein